MTSPEIYTLPTATNVFVARYADGRWWWFPAVQGGFARGREWHPAPALARRIVEAHNGIEHIYRARLIEVALTRQWLGITKAWPGVAA